jgi:hypothetical protein
VNPNLTLPDESRPLTHFSTAGMLFLAFFAPFPAGLSRILIPIAKSLVRTDWRSDLERITIGNQKKPKNFLDFSHSDADNTTSQELTSGS